MKIVRESLNEKVIDQDRLEIDIDYQIDTTKHSEQRQSRHEGDYISDEEISDNVHVGLRKLFNNILHYNIKNNTRVLIKNIDSHLNIVGAPTEQDNGKIKFTIITVMREENFINYTSKLVEISDKDLKNRNYW